ncbi:MAG: gamma-glutamyl-gamma-aminobutyrate hydrolase family protein [Epsilonproteobacteria bacterium]|nr:gamma-glutamyl-gamma-aminobutyrate hydrolase family protein [Campylobacterota bacterium]
MDKRRVVVTGSVKGSKTAWFFLGLILNSIGLKPYFVHAKRTAPANFNGLILSGGVDIGKEKERDELEKRLLEIAFKHHLPIFGICRGMQMINLFFGGTLHQEIQDLDLNSPHPNSPLPIHLVHIFPNTKLYSILQKDRVKTNALHHQAVDKLGEGLKINAKDKNGIVQGIEHTERFILGVQWHPEYLPYIPLQRKLFLAFKEEMLK